MSFLITLHSHINNVKNCFFNQSWRCVAQWWNRLLSFLMNLLFRCALKSNYCSQWQWRVQPAGEYSAATCFLRCLLLKGRRLLSLLLTPIMFLNVFTLNNVTQHKHAANHGSCSPHILIDNVALTCSSIFQEKHVSYGVATVGTT